MIREGRDLGVEMQQRLRADDSYSKRTVTEEGAKDNFHTLQVSPIR